MERLSLYHLPSCPFCLKVRREADRLGIELDLIDISANPEARRYLLARRGRSTVPVLSIAAGDSEPTLLPESDGIVTYLRELAALAA